MRLIESIRALIAALFPAATRPVTRANFFSHPQKVIGGLDWGTPDWAKADSAYGMSRLGLNVMNEAIQWLSTPDANGSVVDWAKMDQIVADAEARGWGVIFDGYCFGYDKYDWAKDAGGKTTQAASIYNPAFTSKFKQALIDIAARYANRPSVVALYATPDTGTLGFNGIDTTDTGREAWEAYAALHGLPAALPTVPQQGQLDLSAARAAYIEFWAQSDLAFIRDVINGIRSVTPDMPILLRGPYMDVSLSFRLASEFKNVAPYCECQETSLDVESYFRGFAQRYGVPIAGENGWPKERGSALRMANATTLLGGYSAYLFSFTAIPYARPGAFEFDNLSRIWPYLRGASYTTPKVGLLVCDSKMWASNPANFFSAGGPSAEPFMERTGIPYCAVSSQWPKLDGLRILADDGCNSVLCAASRQSIVDWVNAGGTLIVYPTTGKYDAAGGSTTLASALGMTFSAGTTKSIGSGKVIVLAGAPSDENSSYAQPFISALQQAGASSPVPVTPYVNQAVFKKDNKTYLVVYNKSNALVGSFFSSPGFHPSKHLYRT